MIETFTEYVVNEEDKHGDIIDMDHADTLEEARSKTKGLEHWSIEKVTDTGSDGEGLVNREHELIEESER
jgi:hypothetical protein